MSRDMPKPPVLISKAEFARRHDLSTGRISQLIREGLPVTGGKIDPKVADAWMRDNLDEDRRRAAKPQGKPAEAARRKTGDLPAYAVSKARHEALKAERVELDLEVKRGNLVDRQRVEFAVFDRARRERDLHTAWVLRIAPLVANELKIDPAKFHTVLARHMRGHLEELAQLTLADLGAPDA